MKKYRLIILLLILLSLLLNAVPVYADTENPDTTPSLSDIVIYQNILEAGDFGIFAVINVPYDDPPDTVLPSTFILNLIDDDDVTVLGSTTGNDYNDAGYGYNVYHLYFDADEVTDLGIVWETVYTLRLTGNPAVFDDLPTYNFTINVADYSELTDEDDVQASLADWIIITAADLDNLWGLTATYSMLTEIETGTVLSIYGEALFREAVYGVQAMAPAAFGFIARAVDITDRTWDEGYSENVSSQYEGTWAETAKEAGAALFNTSYDLLSVIMMVGLSGGLFFGNIMISGDHWNALADVAVLGVMGARLALYDFAFLLLAAALAWIYISAKIWFGQVK